MNDWSETMNDKGISYKQTLNPDLLILLETGCSREAALNRTRFMVSNTVDPLPTLLFYSLVQDPSNALIHI